MDRLACVDIPALPLQILLKRNTGWRHNPVVVVERDKPTAFIQWVNGHARKHQILPGMRYATALSLSRDLRAGVVPDTDIAAAIEFLTGRLWRFSPRVEPSSEDPGAFWLDATGLQFVFPSLEEWTSSIRSDLKEGGFHAVVAVGFSRFGTYAAARSSRRNVFFRDEEEERAHLGQVPIRSVTGILPVTHGQDAHATSIVRLRANTTLRDTLYKLGIETLGQFAALPPAGVRRRFGAEAHTFHQLARGEGWTLLQPCLPLEPAESSRLLDYPETNSERLLIIIEPLLEEVLQILEKRHERLASLGFHLVLDNHTEHDETLSPAEPASDTVPLLPLLRLRLETLSLASGVIELTLRAEGVRKTEGQMDLFHETPRRSQAAVHRAFAALRAELGNNAIVRARVCEGHLPEARVAWEPLDTLPFPEPERPATLPLIRRVYTPPLPLAGPARREPDGWLAARLEDGPVDEIKGPYLISGGWWNREISRTYYYVRTRSGRWLWVYRDDKRRRWFLHGEVE